MLPPDNKSAHMQQGPMTLHHIISLSQYCLSVDTLGRTPKVSQLFSITSITHTYLDIIMLIKFLTTDRRVLCFCGEREVLYIL